MELKHDAMGFLVGTPIDLGAATKLWAEIGADVRAIRSAIAVNQPTSSGARVARYVATPASRGGTGGAGQRSSIQQRSNDGGRSGAAVERMLAVQARAATPNNRPGGRDAKGRFTSGSNSPDVGGDGPGASGGSVRGLLNRISRAVLESGSGVEEADPTVKAFNEVALPMARGYELLTGGTEDKKQTSLLRRIITTLGVFRKEETTLDRATVKSLKAIEAKPASVAGSAGSGLFGSIGGALSNIPVIGPLLSKGAGLLGGMLPKGGGLLARLGKGALKRGPLIGALVGGAMAWNEASAAEADPALTVDQKNAKKGAAWGGAAGNLVGTLAGSLLGPAGAIVGGVVGDWLGGQFGEMLGRNWSDMTATISGAWDGAVKKFDGFVDSAKSGWDTVTSWFGSVVDSARKIPAVDNAIKKAGELATAAKDKAVALGGAAVDAAKKGVDYVANNTVVGRGAKAAYQGVKDFGSKVLNRAFSTGADYKAGAISGLDEAHTRGLVSSTALTESGGGKLDAINKQGYMGRYQAGAGWLADAGLMRGGSAAVQAAMKRDGFKSEWKWAESGGMTHFLDDAANWKDGMSKDKYLASADIQDAAFKTNSDAAYAAMVKSGVIKPGDSQETIAGLLKARHIAGLGGAKAVSNGGEGAKDANGTSARAYYNDVALDRHGFTTAFSATALPVVSANASAPALPSSPSMPAVADSPPVIDPMTSSGGKSVAVEVVNSPDVGQDLRDRRIAHVATGALSG